jgi:hypothetical protein
MWIRSLVLSLSIVFLAAPQMARAQNEFVAVSHKVDPVMQPKQPTDAIAECAKDPICSTVAKTAASYIGVSPNLVTAAMALIPPPKHVGEASYFSISLPGGYQYCKAHIQTISVVPATGDRASLMNVSTNVSGVAIYTWTPRQGLGQGRSWVEADFTVIGVRNDLADKYRAAGTCQPYGKLIVSCRGARGINKGLHYCATYDASARSQKPTLGSLLGR